MGYTNAITQVIIRIDGHTCQYKVNSQYNGKVIGIDVFKPFKE